MQLVLLHHAVDVIAVGGEDGNVAGLLGDAGSSQQV